MKSKVLNRKWILPRALPGVIFCLFILLFLPHLGNAQPLSSSSKDQHKSASAKVCKNYSVYELLADMLFDLYLDGEIPIEDELFNDYEGALILVEILDDVLLGGIYKNVTIFLCRFTEGSRQRTQRDSRTVGIPSTTFESSSDEDELNPTSPPNTTPTGDNDTPDDIGPKRYTFIPGLIDVEITIIFDEDGNPRIIMRIPSMTEHFRVRLECNSNGNCKLVADEYIDLGPAWDKEEGDTIAKLRRDGRYWEIDPEIGAPFIFLPDIRFELRRNPDGTLDLILDPETDSPITVPGIEDVAPYIFPPDSFPTSE